jgi:hypothetical protein
MFDRSVFIRRGASPVSWREDSPGYLGKGSRFSIYFSTSLERPQATPQTAEQDPVPGHWAGKRKTPVAQWLGTHDSPSLTPSTDDGVVGPPSEGIRGEGWVALTATRRPNHHRGALNHLMSNGEATFKL